MSPTAGERDVYLNALTEYGAICGTYAVDTTQANMLRVVAAFDLVMDIFDNVTAVPISPPKHVRLTFYPAPSSRY
jgi:hypothetical protein